MRLLAAVILLASSLAAQDQWQVVWSDEFNGAAGTAPDAAKWGYDLGASGWGNQELENYTNSTDNAAMDGSGHLIIHVLKTAGGGYTSARLKTQDKFTIAYGKIEARMKIPFGQGIWPAFWMLGSDIPTASWPEAGEIDIMENIGREPNMVHGTIHGPGYSGANGITAAYTLPGGAKASDDFHTFAIVWKRDSLEFFVDSVSYQKVTPASLPAGTKWVYNKPFFLLMNVAVGGLWPGNPDASTQFPQQLTVDYVRVSRSKAEPVVNAGGVVDAASFASALAPGSLASVFGTGLADATYNGLFDAGLNAFPQSVAGVSVSVNGQAAPLTYVSPQQINFEVPWATPVGMATTVQVARSGTVTAADPMTFGATAPSVFRGLDGEAIQTCAAGACTLWSNGFGPKATAQKDGAPAGAVPLPQATNTCGLTIAGMPAVVLYCGAAPGLIIDQLNFLYPAGVPAGPVTATLKVGTASADFPMNAVNP